MDADTKRRINQSREVTKSNFFAACQSLRDQVGSSRIDGPLSWAELCPSTALPQDEVSRVSKAPPAPRCSELFDIAGDFAE